jgi:hypothetical protein
MNAALSLIAFCAFAVAAGASGQQLYPVSGPAAQEAPPHIIAVKIHGNPSGTISVTLADGELFQGRWASLRPAFANARTAGSAESYPPQPNLQSAWDAVFGQGYFLANVLGEPIGQSILTGNRQTVLQLEFFNTKWGVAADSKGNVYKFTW